MLGPCGVRRDVRQVHFGLLRARQLDLGFLCSFLQALQSQRIVVQIDAVLFLKLIREELDQSQVKILTTEERIAVGGQYFKLVFAVDFCNFDNRDIKGAATEVIHRHRAVALSLVHAVSQRCGGGLVDDALDLEARNAACVLGRLPLGVIKVRRNRDHRLGHRFAKVLLGGLFHLAQDLCRHLRWRHLVVVHLHPGVAAVSLDDLVGHHLDVLLHHVIFKATANQSLHSEQRVRWIGDRLPLGRLTHQNFIVVGVGDDRRCRTATLSIFNDARLAAFQNGYTTVGGTQVDANDLTHVCFSYRPATPRRHASLFLDMGAAELNSSAAAPITR